MTHTIAEAQPPLDTLHALLQEGGKPPLQRDLARPLAAAFLEVMEHQQNPDHTRIAFGRAAIEALWPENEVEGQARLEALQAQLKTLPDAATQTRYAELLAKLGHLHQLAGLLLRERELSYTKTPKTIPSFLKGEFGKEKAHLYTSAAEAVEALNAPKIELTFTAHPTNTNSLSTMQAQRALGKAISAFRTDMSKAEAIEEALRQFANAPLLPPPKKPDGPHKFSVLDETHNMLYHLNAVYDDMEAVYKAHDDALKGEFKAEYKPESLDLGIKFHSWGSSGDKDGNNNVNADTTLYSLAMHHQHILIKYRDALKGLNDPALDDYRVQLEKACATLTEITSTLEETLKQQRFLDPEMYEEEHKELQRAISSLNLPGFTQALERSFTKAEGEQKDATLLLLRRVRMFGQSFGTLEFRETAEEFTRIISKLIPEYPLDIKETDEMSPEQKEQIKQKNQENEQTRQRLLNERLGDDTKRAEFADALRALAASGAGREYDKKDPAPIAYHTLKRLELARDFPQAIQNHVLAECQDTSNLLELLLLQHAAGKDGKRPMLGIVPLFEDRDPLEKAPEILNTALTNAHYVAHVEAVAEAQGHKPAQQIQLAHSDNARRNGLPAARALIYNAHNQARAAVEKVNKTRGDNPIELQFYEGGSITDSYRGGTRAISAAINEFGIHDFAKMTVQGGDMLNYFNLPHSTYRVMLRNISNGAAHMKAANDNPDMQAVRGTARLQEEKIVAALSDCSEDYKELFEGKGAYAGQLNGFLESIDFVAESKAGNASSRDAARTNDGGLDVTQVRTISFSEGCQHAGLNPSWIGSLTLTDHMAKKGMKLDPVTLHRLYMVDSPLFKDVVDRMLFGLARTDMDYLRARSGNHSLMTRFDQEYSNAFKLCMEAYTGKPLAELTGDRHLSPTEQHDLLVNEVYAHTKDVFTDQQRFTSLMRTMKGACAANDNSPVMAGLRMTLHNGMDTIVHGRLPLIDDPTYATLYCQARGIERRHAPEVSTSARRAA